VTLGSGDATATIRLRPPVPMPTVWIGGSSPAALRRTVRFGDGWLGAPLTPVEFGRTRDRLWELADAAGRPRPRLGTHAAIAPTGHRSLDEAAAAVLRRSYGFPQEQAEQLAVAGTPSEVAHHLAEYVALGVEHLVVINDRTPWQQACDLLRETRDALAHFSGA
jgi:alkanesulfonate monooxygenase SsuD/methylene tetrahydromethanopterin reductase-like flavin-dependent oxidoreductase (luciferase family)